MKPSSGGRRRARRSPTSRSPGSRSRCRSCAGSGRIKAAAARVNAELGLLDAEIAERIAAAGDAVAAGKHDDQFPIDVFQTGSGTSSNMNANEVIANLAGDDAHPNDHVNMGQSSNDVFPSAVHLAALGRGHPRSAAGDGRARLGAGAQVRGVRRRGQGRAHAPDGRGAGDARPGVRRLRRADQARADRVRGTLGRVGQIPLGGTATGTGLNTHSEFAERVRSQARRGDRASRSPSRSTRFEAQGNRDALVELSGALKVVAVSLTKIANDLALMGSGPRAGLAEMRLPALQKGSSIMPGKVNPVICEVVIQVGSAGDRQRRGDHDRRLAGPVRAQRPRAADRPQPARLDQAARPPPAACSTPSASQGIEADEEVAERHAEATLATATALNPHIGYDRATEIVKEAHESGRPLREVAREMGVDEEILEQALDHREDGPPARVAGPVQKGRPEAAPERRADGSAGSAR